MLAGTAPLGRPRHYTNAEGQTIMRWAILIGVLAALAGVILAAGYSAQQPSPPVVAATDIEQQINQRLRELGLTEDQLQDTIVAGIDRFIQAQQQAQRAQQAQQQAQSVAQLVPVDPAQDFVLGDVDAEFSLIEYSDFECPFCRRFHDTVHAFISDQPNVHYVYRHFPLPNHNPQALRAAIGAECVGRDLGTEAFWAYNKAYFASTRSSGRGMPERSVQGLMVELGFSSQGAQQCLDNAAIARAVQQMQQAGSEAGVSATPTFFIRHQRSGQAIMVPGALSLPDLQARFAEFAAAVSTP